MLHMPPPGARRRAGPSQQQQRGDAGVIKTNDDAQATKLSCISLGYFTDEALPLLAGRAAGGSGAGGFISSSFRGTAAAGGGFNSNVGGISGGGGGLPLPARLPGGVGGAAAAGRGRAFGGGGAAHAARKPPLINRGTWARHAAMRQALSDFVAACAAQQQHQHHHHQLQQQGSGGNTSSASTTTTSSPCCQVVVLGAGSDSGWFALAHQGWHLLPAVRYIELDHQEVVSKKARAVLASDTLLQLLPDGTTAHTAAAAAASDHEPQQQQQQHHNGHLLTWTKQQQQQPQPGGSQPDQQQQQQQQQQQPVPPAAVAAHVQELAGPLYSLVAADLRSRQQLEAALARAGFDPTLPTLYVAECVLVYLEPHEAAALLAHCARGSGIGGSNTPDAAAAAAAAGGGGGAGAEGGGGSSAHQSSLSSPPAATPPGAAPAAVVIYEHTRPDDAFGSTMLANLEARGCPLRSLPAVPSPAAQVRRLLETGWQAAAAADMAAVYYSRQQQQQQQCGGWLSPGWQAERARIERLEPLDELEEWALLQEHYCLVLGVAADGADGWLARALQLRQLAALGSSSSSGGGPAIAPGAAALKQRSES